MRNLLNGYRGMKRGFCEKNLKFGEKLYLKPGRQKPIMIGYYCGTISGMRMVQMKNSMFIYSIYHPAFAATENELIKNIYKNLKI